MHGKTLGLIGGGGRIGKAVARRARGFGMRVLYWAPRRKPEATSTRSASNTCRSMSCCANPISFRCIRRLMPETRHKIGAREFALMKQTAFIINTARGRSSTRRPWSAR